MFEGFINLGAKPKPLDPEEQLERLIGLTELHSLQIVAILVKLGITPADIVGTTTSREKRQVLWNYLAECSIEERKALDELKRQRLAKPPTPKPL